MILTAEQVARNQTKKLARAVAIGLPVPQALAQAYLCGLVQAAELLTRRGWLIIPEEVPPC